MKHLKGILLLCVLTLLLTACGQAAVSQPQDAIPTGTVAVAQTVVIQSGHIDQSIYGPDCSLKGFEDWYVDQRFAAYAGAYASAGAAGTGIVYHNGHYNDNGGTILIYQGHQYRLMIASLSGAVCVQKLKG